MTTLTDRYVAAMLSRLPQPRRADLERELRASIADAVDGRISAGEDAGAAEYAVLHDLGDPARLAAAYADRPQYLIGPAYFLDYKRVLTSLSVVVLPIVACAVALAQVFGDTGPGELIGTTAGATVTTAVHLFFWVTLAFAAIERGAVQNPLSGKEWTPDALPPDPPGRRRRLGDLIGLTVAAAFCIAVLLISPYVSPVRAADGRPIGLFDPWLWDTGAVYAFVALVLIGLGTRYLRFYLPWNLPRALAILVADLAGAVALFAAGASHHLINPAFGPAMGWDQTAIDWGHRGMMITGAIVVVTSVADAFADYRGRGLVTAGSLRLNGLGRDGGRRPNGLGGNGS
jgi:hypothetical protein